MGKNILVVCQKSKVQDWINHFVDNYELQDHIMIYDCTMWDKDDWLSLEENPFEDWRTVYVINYDLIWRRPELSQLKDFTLILDESSLIQNEKTKRSKFILNELHPSNIVLLSGTPTSGKYEKLWSQLKLLGWNISKTQFTNRYCIQEPILKWNGEPLRNSYGGLITKIVDYKNVEELKSKLREYGAVFKKTEDVMDLPTKTFIDVKVPETKEFIKFKKNKIVNVDGEVLVGDTTLTELLYQRKLCSQYNKEKFKYFEDLLQSTEDRLVVFYNFNDELDKLSEICRKNDRPLSFLNGNVKDLENFRKCENGVILVQYQAGSFGQNLQEANKIIYFSPTTSCDSYMQSLKRIHRIGQDQPCFYYLFKCGIENKIYDALNRGVNYTNELFKEESNVSD